MSNKKTELFKIDGKPVFRGDVLHVAPSMHSRYGSTLTAEFPEDGDGRATLRADNGAVPSVRLEHLSWGSHPETQLRETMLKAGLGSVDHRDIEVWQAAQQAMRAS